MRIQVARNPHIEVTPVPGGQDGAWTRWETLGLARQSAMQVGKVQHLERELRKHLDREDYERISVVYTTETVCEFCGDNSPLSEYPDIPPCCDAAQEEWVAAIPEGTDIETMPLRYERDREYIRETHAALMISKEETP